MKRSESPRELPEVARYRHPTPQDPDADDLDLLPPTFSVASRDATHTSRTASAKKRKTAQTIQTPSASPRHVPLPETIATSSRSEPHLALPAKQKKRSSLVFRSDKDDGDASPRKERILRRRATAKETERHLARSPRQPDWPVDIERGGQAPVKTPRKKVPLQQPQEVARTERAHGGDFRTYHRVAAPTEKSGEPVERVRRPVEEDDCVVIKSENDAGAPWSVQAELPVRPHEIDQLAPSTSSPRKRSKRSDLRPPDLRHPTPPPHSPSRSRSPSRPIPIPVSQSPAPNANVIPSLADFLHSLDLPRLSRLVPHFHEIGVETPEELLAFASDSAVGKRRRETVWTLIGQSERDHGRDLKRFEKETVEASLEEAKKTWIC
ncbi:uncharacterized protein JCM15063_003332 [Sporobolomyces koalae]|uniref:uncharacterized protein n=1 Tax=Sporobolomyces koalae TaxID=500713 RepID=UPI0031806C05